MKTKPKTIKIGHGYYDLKFIKEIINSLPDGQLTLISYSGNGQPPKLVCHYHRGGFTLNAQPTAVYSIEQGKISKWRYLYSQFEDTGKYLTRLAVNLPMEVSKCQL